MIIIKDPMKYQSLSHYQELITGGHGVRENEPLYGIWEGLLSGITGRVLGQGFGWAKSLMQLSVFK